MSSKRKASTADVVDDTASKRRKLPFDVETAESTTEVGLAFLRQIKTTRDKKNRLIAINFLTLPTRREIPQYYRRIGLPMALDIIEGKLNRREYPHLTSLESDLRRMVSNAKSYNEKSSELFSDAEKIRKLVVSFMTQNNPAYESGNYHPISTPVPEGWQERLRLEELNDLETQGDTHDLDAEGDTDPDEAVGPTHPIRSAFDGVTTFGSVPRGESFTPAVQDVEGVGESFEGNSFQQAQEKIITEMINLQNDKGHSISAPFINLPPRDLRNYYQVIKHPVCLKSLQKAVRGIKGRDKPIEGSFFRSWQAFEDGVKYIWNNAREYNEDGSEIYLLAGRLESYFYRRLAEAKNVVAEPHEPVQPRKVKLRMPARSPEPPKLKLRFGAQKPSGPAGVLIDGETLKSQQDVTNPGANRGDALSSVGTPQFRARNPFGRSPSGSGLAQIPSLHPGSPNGTRSVSVEHGAVAANGVKDETPFGQSSAIGAVTLNRDANSSNESNKSPHRALSTMPPPSGATPRLASYSPHLQSATGNSHGWNGQPSGQDSRRRQAGKDTTDALITNLSISTHPSLRLDQHFHLDIPPSPAASQQSITINLPRTQHFLRMVPTLASSVKYRPSKLCVTLGMQRLEAMPQRAEEHDVTRPCYEIRLLEGVNRIEIEMIAGPLRGPPRSGGGQGAEREKISVFINVAKSRV